MTGIYVTNRIPADTGMGVIMRVIDSISIEWPVCISVISSRDKYFPRKERGICVTMN